MNCVGNIDLWAYIFGINTPSDVSKLFYAISGAVRPVKFETILKYPEWYLCQISLLIMLLFVYTTTRKSFVIFTCRYFKLSWNTAALSQSNCRNFSCSSINPLKCLCLCTWHKTDLMPALLFEFTIASLTKTELNGYFSINRTICCHVRKGKLRTIQLTN